MTNNANKMQIMAFKKTFRLFLYATFFMFILLISNHRFFSPSRSGSFNLTFLKTDSLLQINSKLNSKPYTNTHTNSHPESIKKQTCRNAKKKTSNKWSKFPIKWSPYSCSLNLAKLNSKRDDPIWDHRLPARSTSKETKWTALVLNRFIVT